MSDIVANLYNFLSSIAGNNLLLLVFLVSLFGNIIPVVPIPYLLIVIGIAATFPGLGVIQLAAVSALGAATGKFVSWTLGYGVRGALTVEKRARFDSLRRLLGGSVFLVGFIFAATPLPDDVAFIPMGMMKYSPLKTYVSLFTGKFALTLAVVYTARTSQAAIESTVGGGAFGSLVSVVMIVGLSYLMMRIDWERVLTETHDGFLRRVLRALWRRLKRLV